MMRNMNAVRKHEPGSTRHNPMKSKRKPPRGMFINLPDLMTMVNGPPGQGEAILRGLDSEILNLKRNIQNIKPIVNQTKLKTSGLSQFKRIEVTSGKIFFLNLIFNFFVFCTFVAAAAFKA